MTVYVSTMLLRSLRLNGEKARGATLTSSEQAELLAELNTMMESWSVDRALCYQVLQESFALSNSVGSYTIGSGGAFSTDRPVKIVDPCFIRDSSNLDSPLQIVNAEAYGRIVQKTIDGSYPGYLFYDSAYASGLGTIYLYPEPMAGLTLFINSWKQLQTFSTVSVALSLPPGYQRAIEFNFAVETAGGYVNVSPEVAKIARDSLAAIKSLNLPDAFMRIESGLVPVYGSNILTGP